MQLSSRENGEILGVVKTTFLVNGSFRYRAAIDTQAYINLLAEAQKEYSGNIDIRDITWAIGKVVDNNYEYTAIGKVLGTNRPKVEN
jgi:hypothetical protein